MDLQVRPREAVRGDGPGGPSYGPFYGPSYGPSYGSDLAAASKWGGPYLRAPDIYWTILEKAGALLVPLSELAAVEGYIHDNNTGPRFPNVPFLKSVKDADRIGLMRRSAGVVRYGVKPEGNSRTVAPILFPRTFGTRHLVLWNREGVYGKEFYKVLPRDPEQVVPLAAQLNGTLAVLQRELVGLANLGDGALKFSAADVGQFLVVPDLPPEPLSRAFRRMAARPALDLAEELRQHDRHRMDAAIFDALGLSAAEREAIYEAVLRLVENRLRKARSVKEREM